MKLIRAQGFTCSSLAQSRFTGPLGRAAEPEWATSFTQDMAVSRTCPQAASEKCEELMLKEAAWTAKFIRRQREEEAEELCGDRFRPFSPDMPHELQQMPACMLRFRMNMTF